jgi:hypothetical protein
MNCQIITNSCYPSTFPQSLILNDIIDPFTQENLLHLCERAFKAGMPYFVFAIANINSSFYTYYDAVSYRLGVHNKIKVLNLDPTTRLPIQNIHYFAIKKIDFNHATEIKAYSFPPPHFFEGLGLIALMTKEKIEQYLFSGLNYHILEEKNRENILLLQKIHKVLWNYLRFTNLQKGGSASHDCKLEEENWTRIIPESFSLPFSA